MKVTIGTDSELQIETPISGDTDWASTLNAIWTAIAQHDHAGVGGTGKKIVTSAITDLNITTGKLAADCVTGAKIADDAVDSEHIADNAITSAHIAPNTIVVADIATDGVGTAEIAASAVTQSEVANDAIQVNHKLTTALTLNGSAQSLTGLAMSADQAWKLNYKINNAAGTSVQVGTSMGQAGDFITDEFVGTDLSATYSYSTNQLQITGTNTDVLEYSIEFLE